MSNATSPETKPVSLSTGVQVREVARNNSITFTSGLAPQYLQANLIVLPSRYAADFRMLCMRNPVSCPLLAESASRGLYTSLKSHLNGIPGHSLASPIDIRHDAPRYMVYQDGQLLESHKESIAKDWTDDHVAFLIGCSYSFESALAAAGLPPRHTVMKRNVPMYRTNIPLCPAGVFTGGTYVVSMRPYPLSAIERVRDVTRPFAATHGEPIAWGWEAVGLLGIRDLQNPEWGDAPLMLDCESLDQKDDQVVPVFWGCGVTTQEAVMRAKLEGVVMAHAPGHMIVLDVKDEEVFGLSRV